MKEVQEDEYESDHVSFAWNGTCFHTSIAPLKLRDGNTYTFTYTYIHTHREKGEKERKREREREKSVRYQRQIRGRMIAERLLISAIT